MKDNNGLYYYPNPANKRIKMYVQQENDDICFRIMDADAPEVWEKHGWVPYDAIRQASRIYENKKFNPLTAYDIQIARELLREAAEPDL
jgi:hypothetical protein